MSVKTKLLDLIDHSFSGFIETECDVARLRFRSIHDLAFELLKERFEGEHPPKGVFPGENAKSGSDEP